jgi:hypothetical protein
VAGCPAGADVLLRSAVEPELDRHEKNGVLFDLFFANPDQRMLLGYRGGTYDEFRRKVV